MANMLTADGAMASLDGVVVQNNTWGRRTLQNGADYVQTVEYGNAISDGVRFDWRWPDADPRRVLAYPSLWSGEKPFNGAAAGAELPARLSDAGGLTLDYAYRRGGELSGFNVALDLWLSSDPEGGRAAITHEIMVWLKPARFGPGGAEAGSVTLDGMTYAQTLRPENPDDPNDWTYAAFAAEREQTSGRIDIGGLLDHLRASGTLDGDLWVMDVELGAEVVGGGGWLEVSSFDLSLTPPPAPVLLTGGARADRLGGGPGDDRLSGRGGADRLDGRSGDDLLRGGPGDDALRGDAGADRLAGGGGGDGLRGGAGGDRLQGGRGADILRGDAGDDRLSGDGGADRLSGGWGGDLLSGGAGDDRLIGGGGDDRLTGGAGRDLLSGGAGDDWIHGGAGADRLIGGAGADVFVFAPGDGRDVIVDFDPARDVLDLSRFGLDAPPEIVATTAGAAFAIDGAAVELPGAAPGDLLSPDLFLL